MGVFRTVQTMGHPNLKSWENRMSPHFFILPQTAPKKFSSQDMIFCYPWWRSHLTIPDPRDRARGSSVSEAIWRSAPSARINLGYGDLKSKYQQKTSFLKRSRLDLYNKKDLKTFYQKLLKLRVFYEKKHIIFKKNHKSLISCHPLQIPSHVPS